MTMSRIAKTVLLSLVSLIFLFPMLWVLLSALKPQSELFTFPLTFLPAHPTLGNFVTALNSGDFLRFFGNSVFVTVAATLLTVTINVMAGYALSKYYFKGRDLIFYVMVGTLMIPLQAIMVPIFLLLKSMGLLNSLWGIIIPPAASPTGVFLARQYIQTIPDSFIEAARMDGGGEFLIFRRIIVPLATPIIATIAIFSFMWRWNDFLWPMVVLNRSSVFTLPLALFAFQGDLQTQWHYLLAMTVLTLLPVTIIFLFLQRSITQGIASAGVK